jgi:hypothetical protein
MENRNPSFGRSAAWLMSASLVLLGCNHEAHTAGGSSALQGSGDDAGDDAGSVTACVPQSAPTLTPHATFLWPPNHKLHAIGADDCVSAVDACGNTVHGEFIWGSSDEPIDDIGDGHFAPDILFGDCEHVMVRSERQGPKDGRVYKLGVRVVDSNGNASEGECTIIVDHDQRGVDGANSGEAYRVLLDGSNGTLSCDGVVDVPDAGSPGGGGAGNGGGSAGNGGGGTAGNGGGSAGNGGGSAGSPAPEDAGSPPPPPTFFDAGIPF